MLGTRNMQDQEKMSLRGVKVEGAYAAEKAAETWGSYSGFQSERTNMELAMFTGIQNGAIWPALSMVVALFGTFAGLTVVLDDTHATATALEKIALVLVIGVNLIWLLSSYIKWYTRRYDDKMPEHEQKYMTESEKEEHKQLNKKRSIRNYLNWLTIDWMVSWPLINAAALLVSGIGWTTKYKDLAGAEQSDSGHDDWMVVLFVGGITVVSVGVFFMSHTLSTFPENKDILKLWTPSETDLQTNEFWGLLRFLSWGVAIAAYVSLYYMFVLLPIVNKGVFPLGTATEDVEFLVTGYAIVIFSQLGGTLLQSACSENTWGKGVLGFITEPGTPLQMTVEALPDMAILVGNLFLKTGLLFHVIDMVYK